MSKAKRLSFPGGSVIKNWPADAGDVGLLPDPGSEPGSLALQTDSLPTELPGNPEGMRWIH